MDHSGWAARLVAIDKYLFRHFRHVPEEPLGDVVGQAIWICLTDEERAIARRAVTALEAPDDPELAVVVASLAGQAEAGSRSWPFLFRLLAAPSVMAARGDWRALVGRCRRVSAEALQKEAPADGSMTSSEPSPRSARP